MKNQKYNTSLQEALGIVIARNPRIANDLAVIMLWDASLTLDDNANNIGVTLQVATTVAREYNLSFVRRTKGGHNTEIVQMLIEALREKGETLEAIGEKLSISRQAVEQRLKKSATPGPGR